MDFDIDVATRQVYTCADGTQFDSLEAARAHTKKLKEQHEEDQFNLISQEKLDSYLNDIGLEGRNRVQKQTIIKQFLKWERTWNGEFIQPRIVEAEEEEECIESVIAALQDLQEESEREFADSCMW